MIPNRPITLREAVVFFVTWQVLEGVDKAFGFSSAIGAALAVIAIGALALMWTAPTRSVREEIGRD